MTPVRPVRRLFIAALLVTTAAIVVGSVLVLELGTWWTAPARRHIGSAPADFPAEDVAFASGSGARLRGWFVPGVPGGGGVVLLHGVRESRRGMLGRARFLNRRGYSVLLFDLQSHGESEGDGIRFGQAEALDAEAAVAFLRKRVPDERIGALGFSLGGAACVLGPAPLPVDALVLEAVYAQIDDAVANRLRLRLGAAGPWLTPFLMAQLKPRWGIDARELRPVEAVKTVRAPLLVIAGADDPRTTLEDSERLFGAAPEPKELWVVPGAGHVDFHRFAPEAYEARVGQFLDRYLKRQ